VELGATDAEIEEACDRLCSSLIPPPQGFRPAILKKYFPTEQTSEGIYCKAEFIDELTDSCPGNAVLYPPYSGSNAPADFPSIRQSDYASNIIGNATLELAGQTVESAIVGGRFALRTPDADCSGPGPCRIAVSELSFALDEFEVAGRNVTDMSIYLANVYESLPGTPVGSDTVLFTVPELAPLKASGKLNGAPKVASFTTQKVAVSSYNHINGEATVTVNFDGYIDGVLASGSATFTTIDVLNRPPQADAGGDQTLATAHNTCTARANLSATGTNDPDDNLSRYSWLSEGTEVSSLENLELDLSPGTHEIKLWVYDTKGSTSGDTVTITVSDKGDPKVECSDVQIECTGPSTPVATSCTANDACEGAIEPDNHALDSYELGHHTYECEAADSAGNEGSDTCTVDIIDSVPPVFTFVPPDLTITSCENANIGQALVSDLCGPVLVSNDAPAKFPLGETIVTWRALDHGNNQIEATQRVTAILGDDPSCCPEGTTIKVGTAGNDVITGTNGPDCLLGLGGIDRISAKGGNDFVSGGDGNDIIDAMSGNNVVHGGAGNDQISTGPGNDIVVGHAGDDVCDAGLGTNAVSCEVAANCTAACCATNTCDDDVLDPNACGATYSQGSCLSFIQGSVVERNGHNWLCSDGNCRNCASHSSCAPGGTGCPWGVVWTDLGACN
jgi:hypothetical protein